MKWIFAIRLLKLDVGSYRFSPGFIMTIIAFALVYVMFSLGQWQLSRAQYKENLQQKIAERQKYPAISLDQIPDQDSERVFLPVNIEGRYDREHTILLDNRIVDSVVGYDVYTPFVLANGSSVIVNRGFVPLGKSREILPEFTTPANNQRLSGLLEKAPSKGLILSDDLHQYDQWPAVVQYIDLNELGLKLTGRLMTMVVRLAEDEPGGLKYHQPVVSLNSAKNNGYAFQWFAMMTAVLTLYFVVNTKKRKD